MAGPETRMKQSAVDQARQRLRTMQAAYAAYQSATEYDAHREAWTAFLLAMSTIYSKLEQGAKDHGPSQAWFGRKKGERRKDPLLSYLHHARNSDEHSINEVAQTVMAELTIKEWPTTPGITWFNLTGSTPVPVDPNNPNNSMVAVKGKHLLLVRVTDDRYNDAFDPPQRHMGQPIIGNDVDVVAPLAIAYMEAMVSEASALVS